MLGLRLRVFRVFRASGRPKPQTLQPVAFQIPQDPTDLITAPGLLQNYFS